MTVTAASPPGVTAPRSLDWRDGALVAVDQTALPHSFRELRLTDADEVIDAIARLAIRGAPAIGVAGAFAVALSTLRHSTHDGLDSEAVRRDARRIKAARPTAVNLEWAVDRALEALDGGPDAVLARAREMLDEDERVNEAAAERAAELIRELCGERPLAVGTHCNTGRLATVAWGTALGAIRKLAGDGRVETVFAGETRPLLQGARLTSWELAEAGIEHRVCVDAAMPAAIARGMLDCVVVGADRIAANGDVANKIGTYGLAVAAARAGVPFVVVAPESTFDRTSADGSSIVIEERAEHEVLELAGTPHAPPGARAFNPAFDITPAELVTAIVTEKRVYDKAGARGAAPRTPLATEIARHTTTVPDFPEPGISFFDLSPLYTQPQLVRRLARTIVDEYRDRFDHVLAIEARGFPLGTAVAQESSAALVLGRKPGKLPGRVRSARYDYEYATDALEVQTHAMGPDARVLVVDDVLATGGTLRAAAQLVAGSGARLAGFAVVLEIDGLNGRERLRPHALFAGCKAAAS
jgi:S-methyl-5-thioribose-1-phosphate isomerase/adenine phosphoribosyltransferase